MRTIGYYSSASKEFKESDLEEIIKTAVWNNQALPITGMLMYADGCFFQIIEGPAEKIEALFEKIARDNRHCGIIKFIDEEIEQRSFPDWSMGGLRLNSDIIEHKKVFELTRMAQVNKLPDSAPEIIKTFIKSFYNNSARGIRQ